MLRVLRVISSQQVAAARRVSPALAAVVPGQGHAAAPAPAPSRGLRTGRFNEDHVHGTRTLPPKRDAPYSPRELAEMYHREFENSSASEEAVAAERGVDPFLILIERAGYTLNTTESTVARDAAEEARPADVRGMASEGDMGPEAAAGESHPGARAARAWKQAGRDGSAAK